MVKSTPRTSREKEQPLCAMVSNIVKQIGQKEDDSFRAKSNALAEIIQSLQHRFSKNEMNDSTIDFNVNGVEFCMVKVEGGSFWMGAHNQYIKTGWFSKEPDTSIPNFDIEASIWESPVHEVTVGDFYIGKSYCYTSTMERGYVE